MTNSPTIKTLVLVLSLFFNVCVHSQRPYRSPIEGGVKKGSFSLGECKISSITFKYRLSSIVGEPEIFTNLKWMKDSGSDIDCLGNESFDVFIRVYSNFTSSYYYIPAESSLGLIPEGDNTWGYNPLAGSPDWNALLIPEPIYKTQNGGWNFISGEGAKRIWDYEMGVRAIVLRDSSGNLYHIKD